jgi:universal stress protein E
MITLSSILVDVDPLEAQHPALHQALTLARRSGARVKIVDVLPDVPNRVRSFVTPVLEGELAEHRRQALVAIAAQVHDVPVSTALLRGRAGTALTEEVVRSGHDLLIRSHGRDLGEEPRPFGAIDMELLRSCPCPVWLVGPRGPRSGRLHILAAVHGNPDDPVEQALNASIVEWALTLQVLAEADLTVLQAWLPFGASLLRSRIPPDEFRAFMDEGRRNERAALSTVVEPFGDRLRNVPVELVDGEPDRAIVRYVDTHDIDLVVMGTVARSGITGLVMGNTAERVLQRLRGSVLAVKPAGFQSPVIVSPE